MSTSGVLILTLMCTGAVILAFAATAPVLSIVLGFIAAIQAVALMLELRDDRARR